MQTVKSLRKTLLRVALCAVPPTAAQATADLGLYYTPYAQIGLEDSDGNALDLDEGDDVGDADGLEARVGAAFHVSPQVGLFADDRKISLTANNDDDIHVRRGEARVGARISL